MWAFLWLQYVGFFLQWFLLLQSMGSRGCRLQYLGHVDLVVAVSRL